MIKRERLARAGCAARRGVSCEAPEGDFLRCSVCDYALQISQVRDAILAELREPDERMLEAADAATCKVPYLSEEIKGGGGDHGKKMQFLWQAMLDAIE